MGYASLERTIDRGVRMLQAVLDALDAEDAAGDR
jgi:hypothetical protein